MAGAGQGADMKSLDMQIKCVERELAMRLNVYPKWVQSKRMKLDQANHEIDCMHAVLTTLKGLAAQ
jgi:hypothetical protein